MALDPKTKENLKSLAIEIGKVLKFIIVGLGVAIIGAIIGIIYLLFFSDKEKSQNIGEEKPVESLPRTNQTVTIEQLSDCFHEQYPLRCYNCNKCLHCYPHHSNFACDNCYYYYLQSLNGS